MAMRPRGGGAGPNRPNRAPRPAARPVYEDFRPLSERHQEEQAEKLLIYLPGFMKESIRVSTEGKNTVRVRGERFVGGNKWHRFQEDFQAPDDCNMRGIHANFENGILIITMPFKMPKQSLDEPTKPPPLKTPPPPPKTKTSEPPRKPAPLEPTVQLPKPQSTDKGQDSRLKEKQRDEKKILDGQLGSAGSSETQKGDSVPPKTTYPTIEAPRKPTPLKPTAQLPMPQNADKDQDSTGVKVKPRDEKKILDGQLGSAAESSKTQKGDNVPPKTIYPTIEAPRKPIPLKPTAQLPKPQNADKDQDSRVQEKQRDEKKIFDDPLRSAESTKTQKGDEDRDFAALRKTPLGKTSGEKEKSRDEKKILEGRAGIIEPKILKSKEENLNQNRTELVKSGKEVETDGHAAGGKKVAEMSKVREDQENAGRKGSKEKESTSNVAAGTFSYPGSIGNFKKNLVELNEERQLLVNAGAAVLVIMALGVYVYHSIGSGRAE